MGSGAASRMNDPAFDAARKKRNLVLPSTKPENQPLPALAPPTPLPSLIRQQYDTVTAARLGQRNRRPAQSALRPSMQPRMRRPAAVSPAGY